LADDPALALGLNTYDGRITYQAVGEAFPDLPTMTRAEALT
jgi:alanine dehydrogenase